MILLISETPVAGTVSRLANWIGKLSGIACFALIKRNYPSNAFRLSSGAFGCLPDWESYLAKCVGKAQVLIVHNVCDERILNIIFNAKKPSTRTFYQYHSPPNEPPQYDYSLLKRFVFDVVFSIAQGHGRFIDGAIPVPNIISDFQPLAIQLNRTRTIFSPHLRTTNYRWSNKFSEQNKRELLAAAKYLNGFNVVTVQDTFGRETVTQEEITFFLQSVSIVIDDINTGLFHQTSLEALKAGCAVFSAADLHAMEDFCVATNFPPLPFVRVSGPNDTIAKLISCTHEKSLLKSYMKDAEAYAAEYLGEERLARCYYDIFKKFF